MNLSKHISLFLKLMIDVVVYSFLPIIALTVVWILNRILNFGNIPKSVEGVIGDFFSIIVVIWIFRLYLEENRKILFAAPLEFKRLLSLIPLSLVTRLFVIILFIATIFLPNTAADSYGDLVDRGVEYQWESFQNIASWETILVFLSFVLLAPLTEELFYRGVIFQSLKKHYSPRVAIIYSSVIFAIAHIHPGLYVSSFVMGLVLAYIFHRWNNILYSILLHMCVNLHPFIIHYLMEQFR